ncbi:sortase-like acyltransferase [Desulfosporosinus acidiphilus SJ4]|uniref:Sortase-like acyltransferase n=1 Tax=Desulfosporosinus acidiphilus (strain DSM 22704 / JCM 16185 / SJ4) TaxID=646529 RepID=I4D897_DESAJ|nr:GNAT family N-acetyltransferase [Desulfosporosinus acidiphilus]AFM42021.1 sortase-like acyltransferase [Desulfosporosinus acidiphilus SJ4]
MKIGIRIAESHDLEQIREIYNWAVKNTVATFDLEERTIEQNIKWFNEHHTRYPLYVAIDQETVTGWGSISPFHPRPAYRPTGEFSIYIAPNFQGKGIGDVLLKHLCSCAKTLEYHSLIGLITGTNKASLKLAERNGFVQVGHYREVGIKFGEWLDVVAVQKMIANQRLEKII